MCPPAFPARRWRWHFSKAVRPKPVRGGKGLTWYSRLGAAPLYLLYLLFSPWRAKLLSLPSVGICTRAASGTALRKFQPDGHHQS